MEELKKIRINIFVVIKDKKINLNSEEGIKLFEEYVAELNETEKYEFLKSFTTKISSLIDKMEENLNEQNA